VEKAGWGGGGVVKESRIRVNVVKESHRISEGATYRGIYDSV